MRHPNGPFTMAATDTLNGQRAAALGVATGEVRDLLRCDGAVTRSMASSLSRKTRYTPLEHDGTEGRNRTGRIPPRQGARDDSAK